MSKEVKGFRPGSKSWKQFMAKLYGIGGAVVIVGALFKLEHLPGASAMLWAGLGTEALIFFFSAFEPLHEEPDWSLVYPELAEDYDGDPAQSRKGGGSGATPTQELDDMLEKAKIGPELIESLGKGMANLSETAGNMNKLGDAAGATNEFVDNVKDASSRVGELSSSYESAAEALTGLSISNEDSSNYADNLRRVTENLTALNNAYELQIESSKQHNEVSGKLYQNMENLTENLGASVGDTERYKENISQLSNNLESLNTVYGNMLSAMNFNRGNQA